MGIDDIRREIDELDAQLLELLNRRAESVLEIGQLKEQNGAVVFDPARERQIFDRLSALNGGPLSDEAIADIFGAIFAVHRLLEKRLAVAYYGPAGHVHAHRGAAEVRRRRPICSPSTPSPMFSWRSRRRTPTSGWFPSRTPRPAWCRSPSTRWSSPSCISSLRCTSISSTPCFPDAPTSIRSSAVYSHPQSLAQCRIWLRANLPRVELIPVGNNARAAEIAATEPEAAAIGPALAGELNDLPALRSRIQDEADNRTRFFVMGRDSALPSGRDKTSLVFSVVHRAGSLHRALGVLGDHQINMTFIQSHPTKQTQWEYMFFVDVEGHVDQPQLSQALAELREHTSVLRVLGSYPAYFPSGNSRTGFQPPTP